MTDSGYPNNIPRLTGVCGGEIHISNADKLIRNCDAITMLAMNLNYQLQVPDYLGAPQYLTNMGNKDLPPRATRSALLSR
jgi:hypothetical protein